MAQIYADVISCNYCEIKKFCDANELFSCKDIVKEWLESEVKENAVD